MDQCIWHCEAVRRGAPNTFVIGDMPFLSYQVSVPEAVRNAGRFHKEAGVDAIKLEGGHRVCPQIRAIADGGMLVMGHIGLTPQSSGQQGGFKATSSSTQNGLGRLRKIAKSSATQVNVFSPPLSSEMFRGSLPGGRAAELPTAVERARAASGSSPGGRS